MISRSMESSKTIFFFIKIYCFSTAMLRFLGACITCFYENCNEIAIFQSPPSLQYKKVLCTSQSSTPKTTLGISCRNILGQI